MSAGLTAWLVHPMTLSLVGIALAALFSVIELVLRSLPRLGNVRFQGILEENPGLVGATDGIHVSRLIDVTRWLQLLCLGGLWLVIFSFPGLERDRAAALAVLLPVILVVFARLFAGALSEDAVAVLLRLLGPLAAPIVAVVVRLQPETATPVAEDEEEEASEAEIQAYLEAGEAAGIFESDEGEIVESLVDFFDTVVREVMTPRTEMVAVADTDDFRDLLRLFAETHKSRIPVYHETVDRIIGVVHVKNLVKHGLRGTEPPITQLTRECLVVPENKPLGDLLRDFQNQHQQMAIVVDEYGGTSGLVTLEDILEEIVGEIEDELDPRQPPEYEELSSGIFRMQGRAPLDTLCDVFGLEAEEEDIDTVGGLVFSIHGTVPEAGTEVRDEVRGLVFTVEEMDERRIERVTVRSLDEEKPAENKGTER
jgi:CBS domain containing-hemolysin-like protein